MTDDQYWRGDPHLVVSYRAAQELKTKANNSDMWLMGLYFHDAISISLHNAFRKKGERAVPYLEKPYRITPPTEEEKKAEAEAERQKAIKSLTAWKKAWDKQHG